MRIKTFTGRSLDELLPKIREELGPNAVVLGQREKVVGGIGGFFGTKQIEVTAADQMPNDDALIAIDERVAEGSLVAAGAGAPSSAGATTDPAESALAERFRTAMKMGRAGGIDVTDTWDPAQDAELAHEYGRVLENAAANAPLGSGFTELDVPTVSRTQPTAVALDPIEQARALAERTHDHVAASTRRIDASYGAAESSIAGTYGPPAALPSNLPPRAARSFQASVHDAPADQQPYAPGSVQFTRQQVEDVLRADLAPTMSNVAETTQVPRAVDPISAAIDLVDLQALTALRAASEVAKRAADDWRSEAGPDLETSLRQLADAGVDDDVAASIAQIVLRHRQPFAPRTPVAQLVSDVVEETLDVRSGFPLRTGHAHRLAVVGASSSGKSTVVAKLAKTYVDSGLRVGVVVILPNDPHAAVMQDQRFTSIGADVRYVTSVQQAQAAAGTFDHHDLVIVDTPGSTATDHGVFAHVDACLRTLGVDDVHVVVPLATSSREAAHTVDDFLPIGANRMIVSRVDESRYFGQLLNLGFRLGLPMTFLSDGPHIPEDLRAASAREIASRILTSTPGLHES